MAYRPMVAVMVLDENVVSWGALICVCLSYIAGIFLTSFGSVVADIIDHFTVVGFLLIVFDHRFNIVEHRLPSLSIAIFIGLLLSDLTSIPRPVTRLLSGILLMAGPELIWYSVNLGPSVFFVVTIHLRSVVQFVSHFMSPNRLLSTTTMI
jgi:hypothetical protein